MTYKTSNFYWIFIVFFIGVFFVIYGYYRVYNNKKVIVYKSFGINIPQGDYLHGIDVSKYQKSINWQVIDTMNIGEIKIDFAFIKATEGISIKDKKFDENWKNIKNTNILRGAYHFFRSNKDPIEQADFFLKVAKFEKGDLLPVVDVETKDRQSPEEIRENLEIFLDKIEENLNVKAIIYTNVDFYEKYLEDENHTFEQYPLWIAHYLEPNQPRIQRNWDFWQHSDKGNVNSIYGFVDFNVFNGSKKDLKKLTIK